MNAFVRNYFPLFGYIGWSIKLECGVPHFYHSLSFLSAWAINRVFSYKSKNRDEAIIKQIPLGHYEKHINGPLDFLCALTATIVLSPAMLLTTILVRVKLGSPILFKQGRPGRNGKIFRPKIQEDD